jgi:hypothetical protein
MKSDLGLAIGSFFLDYFLIFFLWYFAQAMIAEAVRVRLAGRNPTLGSTFTAALAKLGSVLALAMLSSVLWFIVLLSKKRGVEPPANAVYRGFAASLLALGWTTVSYFALPAIIYDNAGLTEAFAKSVEAFKKVRGESAAVSAGLFLFYVPGLALFAAGVLFGSLPYAFPLVACALVLLAAALVLAKVTATVLSSVVYLYSKTGKLPPSLEPIPLGRLQ